MTQDDLGVAASHRAVKHVPNAHMLRGGTSQKVVYLICHYDRNLTSVCQALEDACLLSCMQSRIIQLCIADFTAGAASSQGSKLLQTS